MLRVTEDLCDAMTKYNIRPKFPFRYKRGGTYCFPAEGHIKVTRVIVKDFFSFKLSHLKAKNTLLFLTAVKSLYRKQIDEATKDSRIQKWMFATPEEDIDDPTGEIRRLKKQVHKSLLSINSSLVRVGGKQKLKFYPITTILKKDLRKVLVSKKTHRLPRRASETRS